MNSNNGIPGADLITLSSSLAILIGNEFSADEIAILSAFFTALGDNLSIIATKKAIQDSKFS